MLNPGKMQYRYLGKSGLRVSVISFGNMINYKPENQQVDKAIIKTCLENGINFFDTAQLYQLGKCESILGRHLKQLNVPRTDIVISTKIWIAQNPDLNSKVTLSRKHVRQSINKSLNRLQMDYVDVLFAHGWQDDTPLQEICRAFHQVIQEGKALYWATSNWRSQQIIDALSLCEKLNLHKPIAAQNQYNMLAREDIEAKYRTLFERYGYGTTHWSPLAGGFLTGKYLDGIPEGGDHRLTGDNADLNKKFFYQPYVSNPKFLKGLKELSVFAEKELNTKLHILALAWVLKFKYTTTAIVGARSVEQLKDSLTALQLLEKLTPEVEGKINKILDNNPPPKNNWLINKPYDPLRPVEK